MEIKIFSSLHIAGLSVADLYSLNKSTIEIAQPLKENIGDVPGAALAWLETANTEMGAQLNKQSKSGLTDALAEKDKDRDARFAEIKRNISTAMAGLDATKREAAESLKLLFGPYWETGKKAMNTETALIAELIGKINASESLTSQAETIGITAMLTGLETSNNEFDALYKERNTQEAAKDTTSASSLKPAAAKSYEQFCTAVEQAVSFVPTDPLLTLFNQMDELRGKYALLIDKTDDENEDSSGEPQAE